MNLKRFTARTSRDALALVRQALGDDAIVMSTKPCAEGVEVLAMAPESLQQIERLGATLPAHAAPRVESRAESRPDSGLPPRRESRPEPRRAPPASNPLLQRSGADADDALPPLARRAAPTPPGGAAATARSLAVRAGARIEPSFEDTRADWAAPAEAGADASVADDVQALQMSTLSFQDYVRERMLKRRQAELAAEASANAPRLPPVVAPIEAARARLTNAHAQAQTQTQTQRTAAASLRNSQPPVLHEALNLADGPAPAARPASGSARPLNAPTPPVSHLPIRVDAATAVAAPAASHADAVEMMSELRSMRGLIEQRFGALAFMEKLQRQPRQAQLSQRLLDGGFSPALIRRLAEGLPDDVEEMAWAATVLERNLMTGERETALEDAGGVYALIGSTGVGKTTSTAKLAAAFATRHGAGNLGLITLDAYRVAAHEQLRAYGRILGVPVHTAHDRASLEDLLELLSAKKMVLIDTAGMAQRDTRTRELLDMLSHSAIHKLLVVNASAQGETIEDQLGAYNAAACRGVILSKLDEAVKLGPALDALIRHRLRVLAVANGQRVPEDWHRLGAQALVQRALKAAPAPAWRLDGSDVKLIFAGQPLPHSAATGLAV